MALPDPSDPDVLWFAATGNHRIGRLSRSAATVSFPYGTGYPGFSGDGGPASEAWFYRPSSIAFDDAGTMFVSDRMNQVVRAIGVDGIVETVAGTPEVPGYSGDGGPATEATLRALVETDPGNRLDVRESRLVLADTDNNVVREVDLETGIIRTLAGDGTLGFTDGPAASARFAAPRDVTIAPDGTVYVADAGNGAIRVIGLDGEVSTIASLTYPAGVAVDGGGRVWAADRDDGVIVRFCGP
jgi:serine/threonine-protein kinase